MIEDIYCRDLISLPLIIKGHVVRKHSWIGDQYVDLDVDIVRGNEIFRFLVVVKRVGSIPENKPEFQCEVDQLKQKFNLPVYLAVVNEDDKTLWLTDELRSSMAFPDREYSVVNRPRPSISPSNED